MTHIRQAGSCILVKAAVQLTVFHITAYTAISIKVVPLQRAKVE